VILHLTSELILRYQTPLITRVALLSILLLFAVLYSVNRQWFQSMKLLTLLPIQKFSWQTEKQSTNYIFRLSSFLSTVVVIGVLIHGYHWGSRVSEAGNYESNLFLSLLAVSALFLLNYLAIKFYFALHKSPNVGNQVLDFQYGLNQWLTLAIATLLIFDFYYLKLDSAMDIFLIILTIIFFLIRLFGTILIVQNNFRYSILTVFVYLCTFELVPALVLAKVLFVNS